MDIATGPGAAPTPILDASPADIPPSDASGPDAVRLAGVRRGYGPVHAVDGIDLEVPAGQIVAVLGPNGAGKSTLNELIIGIIQPQTGTVRVFGTDPVAAVRAGRTGAMLQGGALLNEATARDMLRLMHGLHRHPLPLAEVIERADCADFLSTKTDKLSGGQAQWLRYALALLPDPDLLILDEPTVAMDVEARGRFWESMRDFVGSGRTVLFATHYLDEADEVADRVVLLARGRVVADGTGAQIKSSVAGRTIRFSTDHPDLARYGRLPGVSEVAARGGRVSLRAVDSDAVLRVLLTEPGDAHDFEVTTPGLEDAFRTITADAGPAGGREGASA